MDKGPFKVGDIVTIAETWEDFLDLPEEVRRTIKLVYRKEGDLGYPLEENFNNINFPIKAECVPVKLNRKMGHLCIKWFDAPDNSFGGVTNVYSLEKAGFIFEHPDFDIIPIIECKDDDLDEYDLETAKNLVNKLSKVMGKKGIVFYRP